MKKLYSMNFDCGRMGSLDGLFVAEESDMDALIQSSQEVYFGEVLGKHSDICGPIDERDIKVVDDSSSFIEKLLVVFEGNHTISGFNPFDYIEDEDE